MTALHGMGFGALFLLGLSGALLELRRQGAPAARDAAWLRVHLAAMAAVGWATVLSGAYLVYPWYRAKPPTATADLSGYPQRLLLASPQTAGWHSLGMEWKEHVAWFSPIAITAVAYVVFRYREAWTERSIRSAALGLTAVAFFAAAVAGLFGAFLDKVAPVRGGADITLVRGE
ncbi:MAG TPA: hypothetical protein VHB21_15705 [Minicystis sp.]|nr:hypothetical protein [Minicystis sp.]